MARPAVWPGETQAERDAAKHRAYRQVNPGLDKRKRPEHDNRQRPGRKQTRPQQNRVDREFITIDGEAIGEEGYHLLAASTGDQIGSPLGELTSNDCLRFLLRLKAKYGTAIYCGFALGYDCEHWIHDFGPDLWRELRDNGEAHIRLDGWKRVIQYIPRKWFKIGYHNKRGMFSPIVEVYDLFTFFQSSFIHAVKEWGAVTPEELEILVEWKEKRGEFAVEDWNAIVNYNRIECAVLVRLAEKLRAALGEADIRLRSWHGPGAVANVLLKRYNMNEHIGTPPPDVQDAIARAYFGGRFQVFRFGHIEHVYDYDISSAYPYATSLLPSTQGTWEPVTTYQGDENPWCVYHIEWNVKAGPAELSPFPWRDADGNIHYPCYGNGWYWGWEVASARRGWGNAISIVSGWRLFPIAENVFAWMIDLAAKRVEAKQQAKILTGEERDRWAGIARAYKLALNSVYGKTIQTVGKRQPFLCPMWAGLITAKTRATLLDAALKAEPKSLVCFATDGLFATKPVPVSPLGDNLGDWELAADDIRLELYQSGCYAIYRNGELTDSRFRGIARVEVPWEELRRRWKKNSFGATMKIPTKRFVGHRTALHHNKPEQQATWVTMIKDVSLLPGVGLPQGGGLIVAWDTMLANVDYTQTSTRYRKLPPSLTELEIEEGNVQP